MNGFRWNVAVVCVLSLSAMFAALVPSPVGADETETETSPCCDCACVGRYESGGWQIYETKNFRLHFVGREPQLAALAKSCERTRLSLRRTWLGVENDEAWSPKCDVYLYSDSKHYARCAGLPAETRGTSNLQIGHGKVWTRRIHMRIDQPGYLEHVLPHELTHVVLADRFNTRQIPRWADEGIAMLTEPPQRRDELLQTIDKARQSGSMFSLRELLTAKSYPKDQARATLFFAQSVALVDYIVSVRSESGLTRLIETAQSSSYEAAIGELFSGDGLAALESRWTTWLADQTRSRGTLTAAIATGKISETDGAAAASLTRTSRGERPPGG